MTVADEVPVDPKAPVVAEDVAPVVETPAVVEAAPPVETPPANPEAPAVVAEAPVETAPTSPPDLLKSATTETEVKPPEGEQPPVETPPEEVKPPAEEAPPVETQPEEPPAPTALEPLAEYKYEVPEDIQFSDDQRQTFHTAIEEARNGSPQALMDLHYQAMKDHHAAMEQNQRDVWHSQLQTWHDETKSHFGERFPVVQQRVAQFRDANISDHPIGSDGWKADTERFNRMLDSTGVGNHPDFWMFMDRAAQRLSEGTPRATTDLKPAPQTRRGMSEIHDNPRSPRPNGAS